MNYLGEPKKLIELISGSVPYLADGWLYIKSGVMDISLSTLCWPGTIESIELSNDEYSEMESWLEENGFKSFLDKEQIEDIASNLGQQLSSYTDVQLMEAVRYYWKNDAYIEAKNG
jgi:hypothetical protein